MTPVGVTAPVDARVRSRAEDTAPALRAPPVALIDRSAAAPVVVTPLRLADTPVADSAPPVADRAPLTVSAPPLAVRLLVPPLALAVPREKVPVLTVPDTAAPSTWVKAAEACRLTVAVPALASTLAVPAELLTKVLAPAMPPAVAAPSTASPAIDWTNRLPVPPVSFAACS